MRNAGFEYTNPEDVEADVRERLDTITGGGTVPVERMSSEQKAVLRKLQDYERKVSVINYQLQEQLLEGVKEQIERIPPRAFCKSALEGWGGLLGFKGYVTFGGLPFVADFDQHTGH